MERRLVEKTDSDKCPKCLENKSSQHESLEINIGSILEFSCLKKDYENSPKYFLHILKDATEEAKYKYDRIKEQYKDFKAENPYIIECRACELFKPIQDFSPSKVKARSCKECERARQR